MEKIEAKTETLMRQATKTQKEYHAQLYTGASLPTLFIPAAIIGANIDFVGMMICKRLEAIEEAIREDRQR